jgi:hypothetical protein
MCTSVDMWAHTNISNKHTHMAKHMIWDTWACIWHIYVHACHQPCVCRHYQRPKLMCMSSCVSFLINMCTCPLVTRQASCSQFVWACIYECVYIDTCAYGYMCACMHIYYRNIYRSTTGKGHTHACTHKVGTKKHVYSSRHIQVHAHTHECACMHTNK